MTEPTAQPETPTQPRHWIRRQVLFSATVILSLVLITILVVLYAWGYRIGFGKGTPHIGKTGILNASSIPKGAQIYVNDHLTSATDNAINLAPGQYTIKIAKDGYYDWQKNFQIKEEVVSNADATLFPQAPTLQSISTFGIEDPVVDPSGTKLAFKIASQSARRNGIYVLDMTRNGFAVLAGQSTSTLIVNDTVDNFSTAAISWSPDGQQLLASVSGQLTNGQTYYLLKADTFNDNPQDVTATLSSLEDSWKSERDDKQTAQIKALRPQVQQFAKKYFHILSWSPDDSKILYQASDSATMPVFISPRRIGNNELYERRDLQKSAVYVYDTKEDVNTRVVETQPELCLETSLFTPCTTPFTWFPDSDHLVYVHDRKIDIVEDDGSNMTTIYAGPFIAPYVYPWPDGSKIVIMTNLGNTSIPPTLYTIGLK